MFSWRSLLKCLGLVVFPACLAGYAAAAEPQRPLSDYRYHDNLVKLEAVRPAATMAATKGNGAIRRQMFDEELIADHGVIRVKPEAADTDRVWSVVLTAGGDLGIELQGVPPYLALGAPEWPPVLRLVPTR